MSPETAGRGAPWQAARPAQTAAEEALDGSIGQCSAQLLEHGQREPSCHRLYPLGLFFRSFSFFFFPFSFSLSSSVLSPPTHKPPNTLPPRLTPVCHWRAVFSVLSHSTQLSALPVPRCQAISAPARASARQHKLPGCPSVLSGLSGLSFVSGLSSLLSSFAIACSSPLFFCHCLLPSPLLSSPRIHPFSCMHLVSVYALRRCQRSPSPRPSFSSPARWPLTPACLGIPIQRGQQPRLPDRTAACSWRMQAVTWAPKPSGTGTHPQWSSACLSRGVRCPAQPLLRTSTGLQLVIAFLVHTSSSYCVLDRLLPLCGRPRQGRLLGGRTKDERGALSCPWFSVA